MLCVKALCGRLRRRELAPDAAEPLTTAVPEQTPECGSALAPESARAVVVAAAGAAKGRAGCAAPSSEEASAVAGAAAAVPARTQAADGTAEEVFGFAAGESAEVWSNTRREWLPCLIRAVFPRQVEADCFTVPPRTVKVESPAGTRYVREGAILQELRKTAGKRRCPPGPAAALGASAPSVEDATASTPKQMPAGEDAAALASKQAPAGTDTTAPTSEEAMAYVSVYSTASTSVGTTAPASERGLATGGAAASAQEQVQVAADFPVPLSRLLTSDEAADEAAAAFAEPPRELQAATPPVARKLAHLLQPGRRG
ncbi:unnamed protein product [Prorocentrum cordatum]|uniref:Uncharacterized protein n=1 Tax=Prorocentrum cordatum TaxID=2364126 RepID=A0ABN9VH69_9DINO|nr:unnamed protein product [Polarella glacialis]